MTGEPSTHSKREPARIAVLASGGGTNFQALIDACAAPDFPARICLLLTNRPRAGCLERAERAGIPTRVLRHRAYDSREAFDTAMVAALREAGAEWVCLAGFMRVVTPVFLEAFAGRVLNIHPSLLPAFPGLHAQQQAYEAGVRVSGCTVHFVDPGVDTGPIIVQGVVPRLEGDSAENLQQRILAMEHRVFPLALRWAAEGRLRLVDGVARVDLQPGESRALF